FEKAEPLYRRSLEIRQKLLPPESLDLAQSYANLGELYLATHNNEKAEPLLQKAFTIREAALSDKNPDRMAAKHDLWAVYMAKGDFARAAQYADEGDMSVNEDQRRKMSIPMPTAGMTTPK
ncbi:MAG TPA: tetratricopeptide repeat protein, partial [Usitatibacter sp.]